MTRRFLIVSTRVASASRSASGNSGDIHVGDCRKLLITWNVTVAPTAAGNVTLFVNSKDPISGNYVRQQTRLLGTNVNGTQTDAAYTLGEFTANANGATVPYTEMRALTDAEIFSDIIQINWVFSAAFNSTFSVSVIGETEEGVHSY